MSNYLKKYVYLLYAALFFYLFILQVYYAWDFTIDDAFISFRYAKNLALGHGLSWNINEVKVEGFSNFSYVLLQALLIKLHLPVLTFIKLFSLSALLASMAGLYLISRNLKLSPLLSQLSSLMLIMHPGTILWGLSGLETAFYQSLIIFSSYFLLKAHSANHINKKYYLLSGFLLSIAGLTRPEAPLLLCSFLFIQGYLILFTHSKIEKIIFIKQAFYYLLGFSLIYAPYFLWRYHYFGYLFPNTVYCKFNNAPSGTFKLDSEYLTLILPLVLIMLPFLVKRKRVKHAYLLLPTLAYLMALYNADWIVGFWHRHFLAVYALLLPLVVCGICYLVNIFNFPKAWRPLSIIVYSILSGFLLTSEHYRLSDYKSIADSAYSGNELREAVGKWMNKHIPLKNHVVLGDCGLIPYISKHPIIDSYCLNNPNFKKTPIKHSYQNFAKQLLSVTKPGYIILLALVEKNHIIYPPADLIIQKNQKFTKDYHMIHAAYLVKSDINIFSAYRYEIFKRNN